MCLSRSPKCLGVRPETAGWLRFVFMMLLFLACFQSSFADSAVPFVAPQDRPEIRAEQPWPLNSFITLAYHDVQDVEADQRYLTVRTANLVAQFAWLRENDYHPVSVDQILALPARAVLLTFDDGFSSFYHRVFPLLKATGWSVVLAPVGTWIDTPANQPVDFGGLMTPRSRFLNWDEIREMSASGLVEIGAHTNALHYGALANPEGNTQPAAATYLYDAKTRSYEDDEEFRSRIERDVSAITDKLRSVTGRLPRVWVWPYGAASGTALQIIRKHGYKMALTLDDGLGNTSRLLSEPRILVAGDPDISHFASTVIAVRERPVMRAAHVDLDYIYDPDPVQQAHNFDRVIQRIYDMHVNTVFLQAFADPTGDGVVRSLYFPNRHLPMRADLFNRAAWQLSTRAKVEVYAWMPVLAFDLDGKLERVQSVEQARGKPTATRTEYPRLSPFDPKARAQITDIYEDLARHAAFDGILFHDDAVLSDYEDASPAALAAYREAGLPADLQRLRSDPVLAAKWMRLKSRALTDFTLDLAQHVKSIRGPQIKTARNIFASPVLDPASEAWFAQNFDDFLGAYDWVVPMVMPLMEHIPNAQINNWLDRMVDAVSARPGGIDHTVFEIQAVDWNGGVTRPVPDARLSEWLRRLQIRGARNLAYYPDNFVTDHPDVKRMRAALSNDWFPLP
jgi:biofilm PGA synthesis lipoprotein PgaB